MDWIRNNKFLAGFIAVMVIGVGGLGFWLYSTESNYDKVSQEYTAQVTELKRLQHLDPFPEESNLTRFADQKKAFAEAVTTLQGNLAGMTTTTDKPLSPTDFQNKLREVVSDVLKTATQAGVALPEDFYLGFEQYRQQLPEAAAMPLLTTELADVGQIVGVLMAHKVDRISSVKRAPVPGEGSTAPVTTNNEKPKAPTGNELVTRYPVEFTFTATPNSFREALAAITDSKKLYVTRALQVKNQVDKGPTRGQDSATGGPGHPSPSPAAAAAAPSAAGDQPLPEKGPPPLRYVVGQEKVDVVMNVELVHVLPPR